MLHPPGHEYVVVIPTQYKDPHGWVDCVDWLIWVAKRTDMMHDEPIGAIVRLAHPL